MDRLTVCRKEDHLLLGIQNHGVMTVSMVGCQEQMMPMVGDPSQDETGRCKVSSRCSEQHAI